jgi:hypothetical protein
MAQTIAYEQSRVNKVSTDGAVIDAADEIEYIEDQGIITSSKPDIGTELATELITEKCIRIIEQSGESENPVSLQV